MTEPITEHDVVALLQDLPEAGLSAGETGAVVHVYKDGQAFEVEFPSAVKERGIGGVVTVDRKQLLKLKGLGARAD